MAKCLCWAEFVHGGAIITPKIHYCAMHEAAPEMRKLLDELGDSECKCDSLIPCRHQKIWNLLERTKG